MAQEEVSEMRHHRHGQMLLLVSEPQRKEKAGNMNLLAFVP